MERCGPCAESTRRGRGDGKLPVDFGEGPMTNHLLRGLAFAADLVLTAGALAGPVSDFESAMRAAYADYRSALFLTNANKGEEALQAIDGFSRQWSTLADDSDEAPPQYADDTDFRRTLDVVAKTAAKARAEVESGALTEAHETLEGIREAIGQLHERNGIVGFSDRMNAYHAMMEQILGTDYTGAEGMAALREDAAVLSYLADDIAAHPAPEAADPAYAPLLQAVMTSVTTLREAARAGDAAAAKQAVNALKPAYSKFFLKFG
jgi:hypothetical protein